MRVERSQATAVIDDDEEAPAPGSPTSPGDAAGRRGDDGSAGLCRVVDTRMEAVAPRPEPIRRRNVRRASKPNRDPRRRRSQGRDRGGGSAPAAHRVRPSVGSAGLRRPTADRSDRRTCPRGIRARRAGTGAVRRPSPRCRVRGCDCRVSGARTLPAQPASSVREPRQRPAQPVAGMHEPPPPSQARTSRRRFLRTCRGREDRPGARQPSDSGHRRRAKPTRAASRSRRVFLGSSGVPLGSAWSPELIGQDREIDSRLLCRWVTSPAPSSLAVAAPDQPGEAQGARSPA